MSYQSRITRADRLRERAEKKEEQSTATYAEARRMGEAIPFGQPILVGHHSEHGDRAYRGRMQRKYEKAFELSDEAKELERRAGAAENNDAVYSDDPEAVQKLEEKIAEAEANQELMKAANKAMRKGDTAAVVALLGEKIAAEVLSPNRCFGPGYHRFELSNNSANIRRMKQRLEELKSKRGRDTSESELYGITIVRNVEADRIQLLFPGKPDEETRGMLKTHGFRWSPSFGAWQRNLNNAGEWAVKRFIEWYGGRTN